MSEEDLAAVADDAETTVETTEDEQQSKADENEQSAKSEADEEATEDAEAEAQEDSETEDEDKPKRKGKSRNQRYADRIAAQAAENAELKRRLEETHKAAPVVETPEPQLDDFETLQDFQSAHTKWVVEETLSKFNKENAAERQKEAAAQYSREQAKAFAEKMESAKTFIPDYDEVIDAAGDRDIASHVRELVVESERAPELIYHFAQNQALLEDMNLMSATQAAREIGRLEATLAKPTPRKQSKAPPPVKPVKGGATATVPLAEMSMKDYAARRTKEIYGS